MTPDLETQLARYGEELDRAGTMLDAQAGEVPVVDVAPRRPRVLVVAAAAVVLALVVASFAIIRSSTGSHRSAPVKPVATVGRTTPLPDGRTLVEYGGVKLTLPPTWQVVRDACPGGDYTLLVGAAKRGCSTPSRGTAWLWVEPAADRTAAERRACRDGGSSETPVCMRVAAGARSEVDFVLGTPSALVVSGGQGQGYDSDGLLAVWTTMRIADGFEPATPVTDVGATLDAGLDAYLSGDCAALRRLAGNSRISCPTGAAPFITPAGTAQFERQLEFRDAVSGDHRGRLAVKVTYGEQYAYRVDLQHGWSLADRRGVWKVVSIQPIDPGTQLEEGASGAGPPCETVRDYGGDAVGCMYPEDSYVDTDRGAQAMRQYGGVPVHAGPASDRVVGVIAQGLGFVPKQLAARIPQLQECATSARLHRADASQPTVSTSCRSLLRSWGMTPRQIDVTG